MIRKKRRIIFALAVSLAALMPCTGFGEGPALRELPAETELPADTAAEASALQQSLQTTFPGGTFRSFLSADSPEDAVVILADNVDPDDAPLFKETVE